MRRLELAGLASLTLAAQSYLTWNVATCGGNADGSVRATDQATLAFRCCY